MDAVLSILVLAAFALVGGAWYLWTKRGEKKKAGLMLLLALVMVLNVAIWLVPDSEGAAPIERIEQGPGD